MTTTIRNCLFCEAHPAVNRLGLCRRCTQISLIRRLYVRHRGWTPAWEEHLLRLTARASQGLPLFPSDPQSE